MKMVDEALRYAKAGIPVFPLHWLKQDGTCSCRLGAMCGAAGKHPRIKNWGDEATTDVAKITGWWSKFPLAKARGGLYNCKAQKANAGVVQW